MWSSSNVRRLTSFPRIHSLAMLFVGMALAIGEIATLLPFRALAAVLALPLHGRMC